MMSTNTLAAQRRGREGRFEEIEGALMCVV